MSQSQISEKLKVAIQELVSSRFRQERAESKKKLRVALELASYEEHFTSFLEELLALSTKQRKLSLALLTINSDSDLIFSYRKALEEIVKKYLFVHHKSEESQIDQQESKYVREFLAKVLLGNVCFLGEVLELCRKDLNGCKKLMHFLRENIGECKISGNLSKLAIFCLHLIKIKNSINGNLLANSMVILCRLLKENEEAGKSIIEANINDFLEIYQQSKTKTESLALINMFLRVSEDNEMITKCIEIICEGLNKKSQMIPSSTLYTEKQKTIEKEESVMISEFVELSSKFLQHPKIKQLLEESCKNLVLALNSQYIGGILNMYSQMVPIQRNEMFYLQQCLINCQSFEFQLSLEPPKQKEVIAFILFWMQRMGPRERNELRRNMRFESEEDENAEDDPISSLLLFADFIKVTIESQFEFEFDEEMVSSVCNLFCYLASAFDQHENSKDVVKEIVKMLLNLNESCEKQYREFLVDKIITILCVYAQLLTKENEYLSLVLEEKLLDNLTKSKEKILYLSNLRVLSETFYDKLLSKISKGELLEMEDKEIEFIFEVLIKKDKDIVKKQREIISWEWDGYVNVIGKKLYGEGWEIDEKALCLTRDNTMSLFMSEFYDDVEKIDHLIGHGNDN